MADFNFYLNRQGVRGAKGAKGDKGDAPIISVDKQSANEFVLKVNNPDGTSITSPNLVGQQIQVTNSGDIVKYNRDTDSFYTSELDRATTEIEGIVRYATLTDVDSKEGGAVVGTDIFAQAISNVVSSPDGSIIIDYDQVNEETTLKIGGTLVTDVTDLKGRMTTAEGRIATLSTDITNQAELLSMEVSRAQAKEGEIENNVTAINNRLTTAESEIVNTQGDVAALDADMATKQNKLVQGDNITLTENNDGTVTIAAAGSELPEATLETLGCVRVPAMYDANELGSIDDNLWKTNYGRLYINKSNSPKYARLRVDGKIPHTILSPLTFDASYEFMRAKNEADNFEDAVANDVYYCSNYTAFSGMITKYSTQYVWYGGGRQQIIKGFTAGTNVHLYYTQNGTDWIEYTNEIGTVYANGMKIVNSSSSAKSVKIEYSNGYLHWNLGLDVDGQTIQIVDGKLHANLDEIGGEVSDVSARVTTLEGQVGDVSAVLDSINGEVI